MLATKMSAPPKVHVKLTCVMFTVEVPPGAIADLINSGIARLPPDHPIKTVRYLPTEGGGCFVAVNSNRQIYFRQWREYIAPLLGEQYVSMLTVSVQNAYKCHANAIKTHGVQVFQCLPPLAPLLPTPVLAIDTEHSLPARKTQVVLPDGQTATKRLKQSLLKGSEAQARVDTAQECTKPTEGVEPPARMLTVKPPFELGDYRTLLRNFLSNPTPWADPIPAPVRKANEPPGKYIERLRGAVNQTPFGWECISALLPPCVRNYTTYKPLMGEMPTAQSDTLGKLHAFYTGKDWTALLSLMPSPDMQETRYHYPTQPPVTRVCSYFEGTRRALALESGVKALAQYIFNVVRDAPSLTQIPPAAQNSGRLLIQFGCGLGGAPWDQATPDQTRVLERLCAGEGGKTLEVRSLLENLRGLRAEAFKPRYVAGTQLGWMLSTMGFIFGHEDLLNDMKSEGAAQRFLESIKKEWRCRAEVYVKCAEPLFKYGGLLTRSVFSQPIPDLA